MAPKKFSFRGEELFQELDQAFVEGVRKWSPDEVPLTFGDVNMAMFGIEKVGIYDRTRPTAAEEAMLLNYDAGTTLFRADEITHEPVFGYCFSNSYKLSIWARNEDDELWKWVGIIYAGRPLLCAMDQWWGAIGRDFCLHDALLIPTNKSADGINYFFRSRYGKAENYLFYPSPKGICKPVDSVPPISDELEKLFFGIRPRRYDATRAVTAVLSAKQRLERKEGESVALGEVLEPLINEEEEGKEEQGGGPDREVDQTGLFCVFALRPYSPSSLHDPELVRAFFKSDLKRWRVWFCPDGNDVLHIHFCRFIPLDLELLHWELKGYNRKRGPPSRYVFVVQEMEEIGTGNADWQWVVMFSVAHFPTLDTIIDGARAHFKFENSSEIDKWKEAALGQFADFSTVAPELKNVEFETDQRAIEASMQGHLDGMRSVESSLQEALSALEA